MSIEKVSRIEQTCKLADVDGGMLNHKAGQSIFVAGMTV